MILQTIIHLYVGYEKFRRITRIYKKKSKLENPIKFYLAKQLSNECSSRKEFYFKVKDLYDSAKIEKWQVSLILGVKDKTLNEFIENFKYQYLSNSWKHYKTWKDRLL